MLVRYHGDVVVFDIERRDIQNLEKEILYYLYEGNRNILVNFEYVDFVLGDELQHFIAALAECEDSRGRLKFFGLRKSVLDVLKILDLRDMFEIYQSEEDAVKALKKT